MECNHNGEDGFGGTAERFMEMGIGMALAGQMGRMVNQTMAETIQSPSVRAPAPQQLYYAGLGGRQAGPFSETEIVRLINEKRIARETLVWRQGMKEWKQAQDVPEILRIITLGPPPFEGGAE